MVIRNRRPLESAIRVELEAVLSGSSFRTAPGLSSFLRYIVERSLDGDAGDLKEYSIGVEALGRGESFEPTTDSIVRVQARRVRERLSAHYAEEGRSSEVRIEVPVGSYVPKFRTTNGVADADLQAQEDPPGARGIANRLLSRHPVLRPWKSRRRAIGLAGFSAAAILLLAASRHREPAIDFVASPLTSHDGLEDEASFSPDGSQIAFTWNGPEEDNFDVYVQTVGVGSPSRLTHDPRREFSPAWSPNGTWIAFLRGRGDGRAEVCRVPVSGGREERLFDVMFPPFRRGGARSIPDRHLSWSPDSEFLAFVDQESEYEPAALHLFSTATSTKRRLTEPTPGSDGDRNPTFSPDGRRLAFTGSRRDGLGIYLLDLAEDLSPASEPKLLLPQRSMTRGLAWGRNNQELLVMTENWLWAVDVRDPGNKQRLRFGEPGTDFPAVSRIAERLAYTERVGAANIWQIELNGQLRHGPPTKLVSSTGFDGNLQISPDGSRIVFMSFRSGQAEIWIADADGTRPSRLGKRTGGTPRWSPDSETIVFDSLFKQDDYDIWTIGSRGGSARPFTQGAADDHSPNWSRDGQWIYFASDRGAGYQVWKKEVSGGKEIQITRDGGFYASESLDGRFVYYTKGRHERTVWRVPRDGGEEVQVLEPISTWNNFTVSRRGIYYTPRRRPDGRSPILFYDFSDESITEVFAPERPTSNGLSISPDGQRILFAQIDYDGSDLMLVEGFR